MNPERYAQLKKIVLRAAELPPEERKTYLEEVCGDDLKLRREADPILTHGVEPMEILQKIGNVPEAFVEPEGEASPIPTEIAGYRIVGKLGEGGMGVVYEAEQKSPRRRVALKVIRHGAHLDDYMIKLFQREIQALGLLKHPAIAAIYESGRTERGEQFFAMELVDGIPLERFLAENPIRRDQAKAEIHTRLKLFLQICEGISYAHQRGVIHRDLKPANILIVNDESGKKSVKILDFGLARITDSDVSMATMMTEVGEIHGTLAYMSPEQARGNPDAIDVRSDVYSLGVIFYEMLTGELPYDVRQTLVHEAVRVILEESPKRPSTFTHTLRGDLETILLKSLEKAPERRYQSALALAEDVERHLASQPILARPPSTMYQLRKLVVRHKALFGALTAVFTVLVCGLVVSTTLYLRAEQERSRALDAEAAAEMRRSEAEAVTAFLSDTLAAVDPSEAQGKDVTVREMLDKAAEKIGTSFADQPLLEATLRTTIGQTYIALGNSPIAVTHLETALELRKQKLGDEHPDTLECMDRLAVAYYEQRLNDDAEPLQIEVIERRSRVLGENHPDTLASLSNLGDLYMRMGRYDEALPIHEKVLEERLKTLGDEHPDTLWSMNNVADTYSNLSRLTEAESLHSQTLEIQRRILGEEHPHTLGSMYNLATLYHRQARNDEAEKLLRQTLDLMQRVLGESHPYILSTMWCLAEVYSAQGRHEEAIELAKQTQDIALRVQGENSRYSFLSRVFLARNYESWGRYDEAIQLYMQALENYTNALGEEHDETLNIMYKLAWSYAQKARYDEAVSLVRKVLEIRRRTLGEEHSQTLIAIQTLAYYYGQWGHHEKAAALHKENLELQQRILGEEHSDTISTMNKLAFSYCQLGRFDEAVPLYEKVLKIRQRVYGEEDRSTINTMNILASKIFRVQGRFDEAQPLFMKALENARKSFPAGDADTGVILFSYGSCLMLMGRYQEAEPMLLEAHGILSVAPEVPKIRIDTAIERLVQLYGCWGKPKKAAQWRAKQSKPEGESK